MLKEVKRYEEDSYTAVDYDIIENGEVVGAISTMEDEKETYIERIDIDEEHRNNGLGTKALHDIAVLYDTDVYLAPDNENAKRLYDRIAYEVAEDDDASMYDQGYGVYKL